MNHNDTNDTYWARWLEGTSSGEERDLATGDEETRVMGHIVRDAGYLRPPQFDVDRGWQSLKEQRTNRTVFNMRMRTLGIAATVLLLVAVGITWLVQHKSVNSLHAGPIEVASARQQSKTEWLPDRSSVVLNAESIVTYDPAGYGRSRRVNLKGEAFFDVKKGDDFTVITDHGTIRVLGTSFNVYSRNDRLEVWCATGSVEVRDIETGRAEILHPGEKAVLGTNHPLEKFITSEEAASWRFGESSFSSMPLHFILGEVERQYDVEVLAENLDTLQRLTTNFPHDNIEAALGVITVPLGAGYERSGQTIRIFLQAGDPQ